MGKKSPHLFLENKSEVLWKVKMVSMYKIFSFPYTICIINFCVRRRIIMVKRKTEMKQQEKKSQEKFNSITQKVTPENQNQYHNVKREGADATRRQV